MDDRGAGRCRRGGGGRWRLSDDGRLSDERLSDAKTHQQAAALAGWLTRAGVRPGDRVAIAMRNLQRAESLEEGMLAAQKKHVVADLARGVSHDVNNALGAVLPLVQQLRAEADYLLDGSVQVAGPRARITVRLSEHRTGRRVWGTTYDRTTEDPFTLQDEIMATVESTRDAVLGREKAAAKTE